MKFPFKIRIRLKDIIQNAFIIALLLLIKASVFGNFHVPTGSMNPTIIEGDKIFSYNIAYGFRIPMTEHYLIRWDMPQRGDIVAFKTPPQVNSEIPFVKRVIGLPGDSVKIDGHNIIINGKNIERRLIKEMRNMKLYEEDLDGVKHLIQFMKPVFSGFYKREFRVPRGHIFVMGDNRDNSHDSRYWGFVPVDNIIGKLGFRYYSEDERTGRISSGRIGRLR